jgi:quinolinate synthase
MLDNMSAEYMRQAVALAGGEVELEASDNVTLENMRDLIVHPECGGEVVARADGSGSTSFIVGTVEESPPGATFVIGSKESGSCHLRED